MRLRIEVREDTLAAGDAFCIVHCTVGLRAALGTESATILPYAKEKYRPNGENRYVKVCVFNGVWVISVLI
jgi:hypothetical protein